MDSDVMSPNNCKIEPIVDVEHPNGEVGVEREEDDESSSLLSPQRGQMSKRQKSSRRRVQWNDRNGNKLVEILEFQPSDSSDSDEDDSDSCICSIM